jgi:hypothetical protein
MTYAGYLEIIANWAAILTAALAVYAYGKFRCDRLTRMKKLERYLKDEKLMDIDEGKRTILHLIAQLAMTEAEILAAAFDSKIVRSSVGIDDKGRADTLFFEYDGTDIPPKRLR